MGSEVVREPTDRRRQRLRLVWSRSWRRLWRSRRARRRLSSTCWRASRARVGLSKLLSHDENWRSPHCAHVSHYETQPLPTPIGWLRAPLPEPIQVVCCFVMFLLQLGTAPLLVVPFRRLSTRRRRAHSLAARDRTHRNYTFFNLLTVTLSFGAVDRRRLALPVPRFARFAKVRRRSHGFTQFARHPRAGADAAARVADGALAAARGPGPPSEWSLVLSIARSWSRASSSSR